MKNERPGKVSDHSATDPTVAHRAGEETPGALDDTVEPRFPGEKDSGDADKRMQVDDYELVDEIARGAMGIVFRARQVSLNRTVALKIMRSAQFATEIEVARFRAEAEAAARLDHPLIVPVYDFGQTGDQPWFSMGLVDGDSLAERIRGKLLEAREAARLAKDLAEAAAYAHREGVIHRDIKPANILLASDDQVRITDFGLARRSEHESELTGSGQILGTPNYMAPEQALGASHRVGPGADVYSIGATLFCMLTGRPPFQAASVMDTLRQVIEQEPLSPKQLNSVVPTDLATICLKCLNKEPHRRYTSAQKLADDLGRFLANEPVLARPIGSVERAFKWTRRKPLVASLTALSAIALLMLIVGGAWYQSRLAIALAETEQERDNVRDANAETTSVLYKSLTSDADFLNQVRPPGYGTRVWRLIDQARKLDTPEADLKELRRIAVSSLGQLSFEEPLRFEHLGSDVLTADVSTDDRFLFVGLKNSDVVVLDLDTQSEVHRFDEHDHPVAGIRMLADDHVLTVAPFCRELFVWRRDDKGRWSSAGGLDLVKHDDIFDFRVTPNARNVIGWGPVRADNAKVSMHAWSEIVTQFSAEGAGAEVRFSVRPVASQSDSSATAAHSLLSDVPASLFFDASNRYLVVGYSWDHGGDNSVLVYDLSERQIERRIETDCGSLKGVVISRDGHYIAVAGHLGAAVFDRVSGAQLAELNDLGRSTVKMFVGNRGDVLLNNEREHVLYSTHKKRIIDRFPLDTAESTIRSHHWDVTGCAPRKRGSWWPISCPRSIAKS